MNGGARAEFTEFAHSRWAGLVRPYRVGAANFVVLATTSMAKTRWIAYSAAGLRLGSGLFYN